MTAVDIQSMYLNFLVLFNDIASVDMVLNQ